MTHFSQRQIETAQVLTEQLGGRRWHRLAANGAKPAGVLMPLWDDGQRVRVVFTKRTETLPHHAGQISFPGGTAEDDDPSLADTALRETHEEIGVPPEAVQVVTRLDQVLTVTRFVVTPFVGLVAPDVQFKPNPLEVQRLVEVPLAKVLDRSLYRPTKIQWQGMSFEQPALSHNGDVIWGATGRMLLNLLDALGDGARAVAQAAGA
jgi:8-oxo-dGTP pyrophosphatase MutT (NUDIX family)